MSFSWLTDDLAKDTGGKVDNLKEHITNHEGLKFSEIRTSYRDVQSFFPRNYARESSFIRLPDITIRVQYYSHQRKHLIKSL